MFRPQLEGYDILVLLETNPGGGTTLKSLPAHTLGANIISDDHRLSLTVTQGWVVLEDGMKTEGVRRFWILGTRNIDIRWKSLEHLGCVFSYSVNRKVGQI